MNALIEAANVFQLTVSFVVIVVCTYAFYDMYKYNKPTNSPKK